MPKHPTMHLTARNDIGPYRKGAHVEDEAEVNALIASEHRHHFIRVAADNPPEPRVLAAEDQAAPAKVNGKK